MARFRLGPNEALSHPPLEPLDRLRVDRLINVLR